MKHSILSRKILFFLFFVSGFCGLVYQVIWTRIAFAAFGIITPVLSVVISVFMLGLSVGSWGGGKLAEALKRRTPLSAAFFYGVAELIVGMGAFAVPRLFAAGQQFLLPTGETDSARYLFLSAMVLALSILPWCICMGATFPFIMMFIREREASNSDSFSYLYLANVLGGMSGTLLTVILLVEKLGFEHTLWVAAAGNFLIAGISFWLGRQSVIETATTFEPIHPASTHARASVLSGSAIKWILFSTGFCAMAMEVVWTRAFTPILETQVYSFAMIIFTYLGATFLGSLWYRRDLDANSVRSTAQLISWLALSALLPVVINDTRLLTLASSSIGHFSAVLSLLLSICPMCAVLGYLTPSLIDESAAGRPAEAGRDYAVNIIGCILGPLFASYVLLPYVSERFALVLLSLPFAGFFAFYCPSLTQPRRWSFGIATAAMLIVALSITEDFEGHLSRVEAHMEVRRDYAASVVSFGEERNKRLLVNGIGMTILTPSTKFMVHMPLGFQKEKPQSALIICFGMGTSYRSALSWGLQTTAVELVPSVKNAFGFYHADAAQWMHDSNGHIVVDDGRRYLKRTHELFDLIVIDPPPPVEAAGSSLLYSNEFYTLAKEHLKPHGILQTWFPGGETTTAQAIIRSVQQSFPYVRCFTSIEGWGLHISASMQPIEVPCAAELAARMPEAAKRDLMEWTSSKDPAAYLDRVLSQVVSVPEVLNPNPIVQIDDDRPYNEYYLLRRAGI